MAPAKPQMNLNDCGCCEGLTVETPVAVNNRPGLSAIAYRVGTQTQFKASMIAQLSESGLNELRKLRTRDDDDFTIALLDSWALVCDVLAFYQERIANESYLRTATERSSIISLARLIGYELSPGVAASTFLAFTLETATGSPVAVTIDPGVRVQSIPGPGEKPQSFETVELVDARGEWNEMKPRLTKLVVPAFGDLSTYLEGITTNLKVGDPLVLVGAERAADVDNENWEFRRVSAVEPDVENNRTLVRWIKPLGHRMPQVEPPRAPKVYALRLKCSLFGFNAPAWKTLPVALRIGEVNPKPNDPPAGAKDPPYEAFLEGAYAKRASSWADARFDAKTKTINLDSVYKQVVPDSWIVLIKPQSKPDDNEKKVFPAELELYQVKRAGEEAKADFNISAKTTLLEISGEHIDRFAPRDTTVEAQSEELALAETPIAEPVFGKEIVLEQSITPLAEGRKVIFTGRRLRALVKADLSLKSPDDAAAPAQSLKVGDELTVLAPWAGNAGVKRWYLLDEQTGFSGYVDASDAQIAQIPAGENDATVVEVATMKSTASEDFTHSKLILSEALANVFDRSTLTIRANVVLSTHGETVANEVLGSGDASQPYQRFTLQQPALTYTSADTPSGSATTLEVHVNDLKWNEVPTLFGHGPRERIYVTHTDDDQKTTVQFGDGVTGARLPMGRENVTAKYRKGIGVAGLVKAGQLSLLMTRPLGIKSVINPLPATGAQDPQSLADARANSPLTVLTLDRIVSLGDYEDFARSFSGIAKALATWTWNIQARGIFVTVAGIDGAAVDSILHDTLVAAMLNYSDSRVPVTIKSYQPVTFRLAANLKLDPDFIAEKVMLAVEAALRSAFSFASRMFGQPVTLSEVVSVIQNVAGIVAVDINKLHRTDEREVWNSLLRAHAPQTGDDSKAAAAELLTLDPAPLELGVMP